MLEISFYTCVPKTTIMWDTVPKMRHETEFLSFWAIFCLFNSLHPNNPENQNFEKLKKAFGDVIILNLCNKKHDHMMYAYSDMKGLHRHNFLSFQAIFSFFAQLLTPPIKIWKNIKKHLDILPFYTCVPLFKIIWCMVPEIWSSTDRNFWSSWAMFCPFTP